MTVGDRVVLTTPENPRLDGARATVVRLFPWGAHVATRAAATGRYRALTSEMVPLSATNGHATSGEQVMEGEVCMTCGGVNLRRAGSCLCCQDCGSTTGCG